MKDYTCLRCGTTMEFLAREQLQLGKTGWFFGDLPNLLAGALEVNIYVCPHCRKIEFYAVDEAPEEDGPEEELPKKTCPACGTVHDFDYPKCPGCGYDYYG